MILSRVWLSDGAGQRLAQSLHGRVLTSLFGGADWAEGKTWGTQAPRVRLPSVAQRPATRSNTQHGTQGPTIQTAFTPAGASLAIMAARAHAAGVLGASSTCNLAETAAAQAA